VLHGAPERTSETGRGRGRWATLGANVLRRPSPWLVVATALVGPLGLATGCARGQGERTGGEPTASAPEPEAAAIQPPDAAVEHRPEAAATDPPMQPVPDGYLAFDRACTGGPVVTIAAIGDVLLHHELQKQAYAAKERFRNLWSNVADLLAAADVTYANLEVPIAHGMTKDGEAKDPGLEFDSAVYTGYPFFNAHPSLAEDLATTGIDIVSTANNHALDRGSLGLERTLDALDRAKLVHAGTRRTTKEPFHAITRVGPAEEGIRIAWVACTLHTNFGKDTTGQVLHCFKKKDRAKLLATVRDLAAADDVDAVVVTPHWGKEYATSPHETQIELAQDLVDAGATAVLGAHPHVLQPWTKLTAADGREAFVIYSLGNFAHHQRSLDRRSSMILYLGLHRDAQGRVVPAGVGYVPIHVRMEGDKQKFFVEAVDRVPRSADTTDARALVVEMFGEGNLLGPDEAAKSDKPLARQCPVRPAPRR